jgi:2-polyprenyl-3-methyl-5-hydroxy-6-metoxy-1,4-benzoquinol methylase
MDNSIELFPANINLDSLTPEVFSARRLPDKLHFRIVKCIKCGLVRSDPIAPSNIIEQLYMQSSFTYKDEIINLRNTYGKSLSDLLIYRNQKDKLLEIGCGNGFFLEEALVQGYRNVFGVEPSIDAVEDASPAIRKNILSTTMVPGLFSENQMDVVCIFQVLDHVMNPSDLIGECFKILKSGGLILCITHNITSWSARLFQERSPIIDIEHTFLFSPETLSNIFINQGFIIKRMRSFRNIYSINYLMRLLPIKPFIKLRILKYLEKKPIFHVNLSVPLGNIEVVGQKP